MSVYLQKENNQMLHTVLFGMFFGALKVYIWEVTLKSLIDHAEANAMSFTASESYVDVISYLPVFKKLKGPFNIFLRKITVIWIISDPHVMTVFPVSILKQSEDENVHNVFYNYLTVLLFHGF